MRLCNQATANHDQCLQLCGLRWKPNWIAYRKGVIRPVEFMEWAAPIVPVLKASVDIRICGDYKVTINQAVKVDKYQIPNIDDLFTKIIWLSSIKRKHSIE